MKTTVILDEYDLMDYAISEAEIQWKNKSIINEYNQCHTPNDYLKWLLSFKTTEQIIKDLLGYVEMQTELIVNLDHGLKEDKENDMQKTNGRIADFRDNADNCVLLDRVRPCISGASLP